jgi:hypothetical protein
MTAPRFTTPLVGVLGSSSSMAPLGERDERGVGRRPAHRADEQPPAAEAGGRAVADDVDVELVALADAVGRDRRHHRDDGDVLGGPELADGDGVVELGEQLAELVDGGRVVAAVAGAVQPDHESGADDEVSPLPRQARDVGDLDGQRVGRRQAADEDGEKQKSTHEGLRPGTSVVSLHPRLRPSLVRPAASGE